MILHFFRSASATLMLIYAKTFCGFPKKKKTKNQNTIYLNFYPEGNVKMVVSKLKKKISS